MHDRCRMTMDTRIPTTSGRRTLGLHRQGRHCLHQARGAVGCWASRMKGFVASYEEPLWRRMFLHMDNSVNSCFFLEWPLAETAMGLLCASRVPYHIHTTRHDHPPCAELRFYPHEKDLTRPPATVHLQKSNGASLRSERSVLQRCRHRRPLSLYNIYVYARYIIQGGEGCTPELSRGQGLASQLRRTYSWRKTQQCYISGMG